MGHHWRFDGCGLERRSAHVKHGHHFCQTLCLLIHGHGGRAGFLNQGRVLLRHLVQIADRLIHLRKAIVLLARSGAQLTNQIGHAAHTAHNLLHALAGLRDLCRASIHVEDAGGDQGLDFFGRLSTAPGQTAHFPGHHGKTTALFACAGGFYRRVQRQNVGLESDAVNHANDVADLAAGAVDLRHALHHLLHHRATAFCRLYRRACQLIGLPRGVCRLGDGGGQLFQAGSGFFQIGRRLLGTCRQVMVARGNLAGRRRYRFNTAAHFAHHGAQFVGHGTQAAQQMAQLVFAVVMHIDRQITRRDGVCQIHGTVQRARN